MLQYAGVGLFAEVPRIDEDWPKVADSRNAVVVLGMATLPDVPSSKVIKALTKWATDLEAQRRQVDHRRREPDRRRVLQRGGIVDVLGDDGIVPERHGSSARSKRPSSAGGGGSPRAVASA